MAKYDVTGTQGLYELDSNDLVLANKLGISKVTEIDEAELVLLEKIYEEVLLTTLYRMILKSLILKPGIVVGLVMCMNGLGMNARLI